MSDDQEENKLLDQLMPLVDVAKDFNGDYQLARHCAKQHIGLNQEQFEAAMRIVGPVRIVAGPGTGKTRVLIHRIGTLLSSFVPPDQILAITFTNKAAGEIKQRLESMHGMLGQQIVSGTFHSVLFREFMQANPDSLYFDNHGINILDTNIIDETDAKTLADQALNSLPPEHRELAEVLKIKGKTFLEEISFYRSRGLSADDVLSQPPALADDKKQRFLLIMAVWQQYETLCKLSGAMDFDDVLVHTNKMLAEDPDTARLLSDRFRFVCLDEYQDTNIVQMNIADRLVNSSSSGEQNIFVVGDEKQSIYAFRHAQVDVMLGFNQRFKNSRDTYLVKNYRSRPEIIRGANSIAGSMEDSQRITDGHIQAHQEEGDSYTGIKVVRFDSDRTEASFITKAIVRDVQIRGLSPSDICILYRRKKTRTELEKTFVEVGIPYSVIGDTAFYARQEVKDVTALLRWMIKPWDATAALRCLQRMSIGVSLDRIKKAMGEGIKPLDFLDMESKRTKKNSDELLASADKTRVLLSLLKSAGPVSRHMEPKRFMSMVKDVLSIYMLPAMLRNKKVSADKTLESYGVETVDNINFMLDRFEDLLHKNEDSQDALNDMTLAIEAASAEDEDTPKVNLMTMHAAKGLEYRHVYLIGYDQGEIELGEGLSDEERHEELRLFYVAETRAIDKFIVSWADQRMQFGRLIETEENHFVSHLCSSNNLEPVRLSRSRLQSDSRPPEPGG